MGPKSVRNLSADGELSGATVEEAVLVSGRGFGFDGANVGSERRLLEGNGIFARDGFPGFRNGKKGGH